MIGYTIFDIQDDDMGSLCTNVRAPNGKKKTTKNEGNSTEITENGTNSQFSKILK